MVYNLQPLSFVLTSSENPFFFGHEGGYHNSTYDWNLGPSCRLAGSSYRGPGCSGVGGGSTRSRWKHEGKRKFFIAWNSFNFSCFRISNENCVFVWFCISRIKDVGISSWWKTPHKDYFAMLFWVPSSCGLHIDYLDWQSKKSPIPVLLGAADSHLGGA